MNRFLNKLERKLGRYAIPNLTSILIGCFVVGYIIQALRPEMISYMTLDPVFILKGQVWRLFTWFVVPPSTFDIFTLIMLLFYFSIGRSLERTWGTFRYNVYIFGGMLISLISAFLCYFVLKAAVGSAVSFGGAFSTYYICMSLFLAYAMTYPNAGVLLMFVIPVKVKWLGIIYGVYIGYDVLRYIRMYAETRYPAYLVLVVAILASVANFVIFFFSTRGYRKYDPREIRRKREFQRSYRQGIKEQQAWKSSNPPYASEEKGSHPARYTQDAYQAGTNENGTQVFTPAPTRHRCVICGRTEVTNPELTFRYCSKCTGGKEYCQDHLFTHEHS